MLTQMKWFALFIWIRPVLDRMGRDQEEKLQPLILKKKWTLSLEFRSTVNFSLKKRRCHSKSLSNTFMDLAVAEVIFFVSKNPIEKKMTSKTRQIFLLSPKVWGRCVPKWNFPRARKFYFNAEQNEAASERRLSFVLHPCRQYFVPFDRSRIDVKI